MGTAPDGDEPFDRGLVDHSASELAQGAASDKVLDLTCGHSEPRRGVRDSQKTHD
jgi:hypothetical protein